MIKLLNDLNIPYDLNMPCDFMTIWLEYTSWLYVLNIPYDFMTIWLEYAIWLYDYEWLEYTIWLYDYMTWIYYMTLWLYDLNMPYDFMTCIYHMIKLLYDLNMPYDFMTIWLEYEQTIFNDIEQRKFFIQCSRLFSVIWGGANVRRGGAYGQLTAHLVNDIRHQGVRFQSNHNLFTSGQNANLSFSESRTL